MLWIFLCFLQIFDASYSLDMEHMSQTIILESSTLVWILKIQNVYDYLNLQNLLKLHLLFGVITFCPTMGIRVFSERKLSYFSRKRLLTKNAKTMSNFAESGLAAIINCAKKTCWNFCIFRVQTKCEKQFCAKKFAEIFAIRFPLFVGNTNRNWLFRKVWERTTV